MKQTFFADKMQASDQYWKRRIRCLAKHRCCAALCSIYSPILYVNQFRNTANNHMHSLSLSPSLSLQISMIHNCQLRKRTHRNIMTWQNAATSSVSSSFARRAMSETNRPETGTIIYGKFSSEMRHPLHEAKILADPLQYHCTLIIITKNVQHKSRCSSR